MSLFFFLDFLASAAVNLRFSLFCNVCADFPGLSATFREAYKFHLQGSTYRFFSSSQPDTADRHGKGKSRSFAANLNVVTTPLPEHCLIYRHSSTKIHDIISQNVILFFLSSRCEFFTWFELQSILNLVCHFLYIFTL